MRATEYRCRHKERTRLRSTTRIVVSASGAVVRAGCRRYTRVDLPMTTPPSAADRVPQFASYVFQEDARLCALVEERSAVDVNFVGLRPAVFDEALFDAALQVLVADELVHGSRL